MFAFVNSAFPRPPIAIQGEIVQVTSDSNIEETFAALFPSVKPSKKSSNGRSKQTKSKKRKSKQVS